MAEHLQVRRGLGMPPAPGASMEPGLAHAAAAAERDTALWAAEFEWLLRHPAVGPVTASPADARDGDPVLGPWNLVNQHATRFPVVSGEASWLAERSMTVVARRVAPFLAAGQEASIDLTTLTRDQCPAREQREHMRLVASGCRGSLPAALARYGVLAQGLSFSASAGHPGLGELFRLRECAPLGWPRILVRVPDRLMLALRGAETAEAASWPGDPQQLWLGLTSFAHQAPGIHLVLEHTTRPACALAGHERGDAVLPLSLFEAGHGTAWPAVRIALERLGAGSPASTLAELRRLLRAALRLADNLVDRLDWHSAELAQDALVNRRVAIHLTGIGDLMDHWQLDPAEFSSVNLAVRWMGHARRLMHRESNLLARERGPFPGLDLRDISTTLCRSLGSERARHLLRRAGLRHRHLLVLSPYSVLPCGGARHPLPAYLHLLPVLRWGDTVAMFGDGAGRALPLTAFRRLLRTSWAIARNRP